MTAKRDYDKDKLLEILKHDDFRAIDETGKVFFPSHPVYKLISERMLEEESAIHHKHVYTIIKGNRRGVYNLLLDPFQIKVDKDDETFCNDQSWNMSIQRSLATEAKKQFKLIIAAERWAEIKNKKRTKYGDRKYRTLKQGEWTNLFAQKIWEQHKIDCCFAFKYAKLYSRVEAKCYARFKGICTECGAKLSGKVLKKPSANQDAIFDCVLANIVPEFLHTKKRQLKGFLRENIASKLLDEKKDAATWRREEAGKLMEFGDNIPPTLYSAAVLRKAKQEEMDKRLQLAESDPIVNLINAAQSTHRHIIQNVSGLPFFCMYWTKEQFALYKVQHKEDPYMFMTVDATGSICKRIVYDGGKSAHLFLYQIMCVSEEGSFPAFQMVSSKQDVSTISYFFMEIVRSGAPRPRMIVSDFGWAIVISAAAIFAECGNLHNYLRDCYEIIVLQRFHALPTCFVRLDVSHFIAMICRWKCLKGKPPKVRQFFIRSLAIAYQIDVLVEVESFLSSVLVVAMSEEIGVTEKDEILPSQIHLTRVNNAIKGSSVEPVEDDHDLQFQNDDDNEDSMYEENSSATWAEWTNCIYESARSIAVEAVKGSIVNAFYNPEAVKRIKFLMYYLPLWTGVLRPYMNIGNAIATSSSVEAEFSDIKNRTFKGQLPLRTDKFILTHISTLNNKLSLFSGKCNKTKKDLMKEEKLSLKNVSKKRKRKYSIEEPNINAYVESENWRGLENINHNIQKETEQEVVEYQIEKITGSEEENSLDREIANLTDKRDDTVMISTDLKVLDNIQPKSRRPKRPNYLDPCPDWNFIQTNQVVGIPILKNGNSCEPARIDKMKMIVTETCAFDSIIQVIMNALAMYALYKQLAQPFNKTFTLADAILTRGKICSSDYSDRARILSNIQFFNIDKYTRGIASLNANCNAAELAEHMFQNMLSVTNIKHCAYCMKDVKRTLTTCSLNIDIIIENGLNSIQKAIEDIPMKYTTCTSCQNIAEYSREYGPHLVIDISEITSNGYYQKYIQRNNTLNTISKYVNVEDRSYYLAGIVQYYRSDIGSNNGHYTAITYTGFGWYEYNDLQAKRTIVGPELKITPHVLLYVINENK